MRISFRIRTRGDARTGLFSSIQSSRHSGNSVDCPRSAPSTKRFIRSPATPSGSYHAGRFHTPRFETCRSDFARRTTGWAKLGHSGRCKSQGKMANGYHCTQLKCGRMDTPRNLQAGAFAGTAEAYFRYRPPYPKALLASLVTQAHLPGSAVLLDLACGPGRVTLDRAASFEHVHAIDLETEMIEVGRREAARRGVRNVEWRVGRAEEVSIAAESITDRRARRFSSSARRDGGEG